MIEIEKEYNLKPIEFLKTLNTRRLLSYYKSERQKFYNTDFFVCEGQFRWDCSSKYGYLKEIYYTWKERLSEIKDILNQREHIGKKVIL